MKKSYPKRIQIEKEIYDIAYCSIKSGATVGLNFDVMARCIARDVVRKIQNGYRRRVR